MANEIKRTVHYRKEVWEDGVYKGMERDPNCDEEHVLHWNPEDDAFELWAEGDIPGCDWCESNYGVFEFDLNVEEARRLHVAISEWLMKRVPGLGVYMIQFRDILIDDGSS